MQVLVVASSRLSHSLKPTELMEEERHCRIKAQEAIDHKARVEESKNTTVDDLTRGIINYTYLGFDFVKAKGNGLRCVETKLSQDKV